jgi:hypothetical protein
MLDEENDAENTREDEWMAEQGEWEEAEAEMREEIDRCVRAG